MSRLRKTCATISVHAVARTARGFSLISAIFLMVVLAMLGVAMLLVSTTQNQSSALDVQGALAYQAARAGIEWGLYQNQQNNNTCLGSTNIVFPAGTALSGFTVTVQCQSNQYATQPASGTLVGYLLIATACNQPTAAGACPNQTSDPSYVQRVVLVQL